MTSLQIKALEKRFGEVAALAGVNLIAGARSRTAIVGPSGSGKTTLLRLIAGFDAPDSGTIILDGTVLVEGRQSVPSHQRGIGVIAQDGALFPHLSVGDNIGFGLARDESERANRVVGLAEAVGLAESMLKRKPDELSGGQQQRVAIARALARKPKLMLLDEPFSALDTSLRAAMRKTVGDILDAAGVTSILVTHDQAEALSFAHQVAVMSNGLLAQVGTPRELYFRPTNRMVAEFLGEALILPARIEAGFAVSVLGRLPLNGDGPEAARHIMIRPEQVVLARGEAATQGGALLGRVVGIDFAGAHCQVTIDLVRPASGFEHPTTAVPPRLILPVSAFDLPDTGETVALHVASGVHPLD